MRGEIGEMPPALPYAERGGPAEGGGVTEPMIPAAVAEFGEGVTGAADGIPVAPKAPASSELPTGGEISGGAGVVATTTDSGPVPPAALEWEIGAGIAGIFGESFHGMPLLGLAKGGGVSAAKASSSCGSGGSIVRAVSMGSGSRAVAFGSGAGGRGSGAAGRAALLSSLPHPRQNL